MTYTETLESVCYQVFFVGCVCTQLGMCGDGIVRQSVDSVYHGIGGAMEVTRDIPDTPGASQLPVDEVVVDLLFCEVVDAASLRAEAAEA